MANDLPWTLEDVTLRVHASQRVSCDGERPRAGGGL